MKKKRGRKPGGLSGKKAARCPYCGSPVTLRSAEGIYRNNANDAKLYICSRYPVCDAYVRVRDGTKNTPVGSLANGELRALRIEAHRYFDKIHKLGLMSRQDAYSWLAGVVAAPMFHAHIGQLGEYSCKVVIEESKRFIENNNERLRRNAMYGVRRLGAAGGGRHAAEYTAAAAGRG